MVYDVCALEAAHDNRRRTYASIRDVVNGKSMYAAIT